MKRKSFPNARPASFPISTRSSKRFARCFSVFQSQGPVRLEGAALSAPVLTRLSLRKLIQAATKRRPPTNPSQEGVDGEARWTSSFPWRVKGAWWPSRSSKPLSARSAGRGRFDSYPLRFRFFQCDPQRFGIWGSSETVDAASLMKRSFSQSRCWPSAGSASRARISDGLDCGRCAAARGRLDVRVEVARPRHRAEDVCARQAGGGRRITNRDETLRRFPSRRSLGLCRSTT